MVGKEPQRLLTYDQLAELLQISPGTLRNWVSQQFIPHTKVGRNVRFDLDTIDKWIKRRTNPGRLRMRHDV